MTAAQIYSFRKGLQAAIDINLPRTVAVPTVRQMSLTTSLGDTIPVNICTRQEAALLTTHLVIDRLKLADKRCERTLNLMLPASTTLVKTFSLLGRAIRENELRVNFWHIDEFIEQDSEGGWRLIDGENPASLKHLLRQQGMEGLPNCKNSWPDPAETGTGKYEERIMRAGGIDINLTAVGEDGHFAFVMPSWWTALRTIRNGLTDFQVVNRATRRRDARKHNLPLSQIPRRSISVSGLAFFGRLHGQPRSDEYLRPRHVVFHAFGRNKARAVKAALQNPLSRFCPASLVQEYIADNFLQSTLILDEEAASLLEGVS